MADLSYTVAIEAGGAQATLTKLNKQVEALDNAFGGLKAALAGLAFGTMIANANRLADSISDMSDATEIAISTIMGFNSALMQNGGDADAATNSIGKFAQAIGDAVGGSSSAQKAFADVGVSLKDIQTLSNEDLLKRTVDGLGKMESSAKRITTQVALFGKSARSVNFAGVGDGMGAASQSSQSYTAAIQAGAAAQQSLEMNMKNMTVALLQVIQPLNKLVAGINISTDAFATIFKIIGYVAGAFLIFGRGLGVVKSGMDVLLPALRGVGGAFAWFGGQVMLMIGNFGQIFTNLAKMVGILGSGATASVSLAAALAAALRVGLRFLGITAIIMAVVEAVNFLIKSITGFDVMDSVVKKFGQLYDAAKNYFNLGAGGGRGGNADTLKAQQEQAEKMRKEYEATSAKAKEFAERQSKLAMEITKVGDAMKFNYDRQLQQLSLETQLIGKSDEQVESLRAVAQLYEKQEDAIKGLLETRALWAQGTEEQKASLGIIDAQIAKVKELTATQATNLTGYIDRLQVARILEKDRLQVFEDITKQMERQTTLGDQLRNANDKMKDVQFEASQQGKSPMQQQFAQIQEDARKAALEAGRVFAAAFEDSGDGLSSEKAKELADGLAEIAKRYDTIAQAQMANVESSRTFEAGWVQAFNSYADSATNAAKRAGDLFSAVTNNMNSAIDNFVDTGKFKFADFASSLIKDMIKIELKASAMNLMKMMGGAGGAAGGGGLLAGLGSMLGFANGGNPPIGKASVVGENGPELIVPRTASTVIPNGAGGGGVTNNYITNNINAVDAKSVAQLFAENRKALLGSVKMAEKEMPYKMR